MPLYHFNKHECYNLLFCDITNEHELYFPSVFRSGSHNVRYKLLESSRLPSRYSLHFKTAAAAARVEAERSCAVRNTHFHHQQSHHPPPGCSTGLSWLGTSTPKSSVFAPLPGISSSGGQSNSWNLSTEKSSSENLSQYQNASSPVKLEVENSRSNLKQTSTSGERNENVNGRNSGLGSSGGVGTSTSSSSSSQNAFHAFSTTPKEEGENSNAALPHTPSSAGPTNSSRCQHMQQGGDQSSSNPQQLSTSSLEGCQLSQQKSLANNHQNYQQSSTEMKQESSLLSQTSASILPYSHSYLPASMGGYTNGLSSYENNKESLSAFSKNKSKNRSSTG